MMQDTVNALIEIINKYPMVLNDEKKLKSILKDYFPDNKRLQNHLFMVVDEGIVEKFKMLGYIHALSDDYGISETMAKDAVMNWVKALGIHAEDVQVKDSRSSNNPNQFGNVVDYTNVGINDIEAMGSIIRFSGEGTKVIPNVVFNGGMYAVKASFTKSLIVKFFDYQKHDQAILISTHETIWRPRDEIKFEKPGVVQVSNTEKKWNVEMIPIN